MHPTIETRRDELAALCARHGVRRLDLFGSAATGRFDPQTSDFDFLVDFESAPPAEMADRYFGLLESLEALLGRPVDLVMSSAIRNPYFRQAVESSRTLLYAA